MQLRGVILLVPWISSSPNTQPFLSSLISLLFVLGHWRKNMSFRVTRIRVTRISYLRWFLRVIALEESCEWFMAFWRINSSSRNMVSSWADSRSGFLQGSLLMALLVVGQSVLSQTSAHSAHLGNPMKQRGQLCRAEAVICFLSLSLQGSQSSHRPLILSPGYSWYVIPSLLQAESRKHTQ